MYTAVLGDSITIDTINGRVKIKVVPGTQNNTQIRLKGKGLPYYNQSNKYGDLIVTYEIKIPTELTEEETKLFKELRKSA